LKQWVDDWLHEAYAASRHSERKPSTGLKQVEDPVVEEVRVETLRKPSTGLKRDARRWVSIKRKSGRDTQKTQHGIEKHTSSDAVTWSAVVMVETLRKPSTGLKRCKGLNDLFEESSRDTQKTQHGIETLRKPSTGLKTQHGIETRQV